MKIGWSARVLPLDPVAVVATGDVARQLGLATARRSDADLARLFAFGSDDGRVLVVTGDPAALPWRDGVVYLGRDPRAAGLLLPTTLESGVDPGLLERAVRARLGSVAASTRIAVIPEASQLIPLPAERAMARALLEAWVEAHRAA